METTNIKTGFAWKPEVHTETRRVELLITRAEGIYQDHFDTSDVQFDDHESEKLSTYNLQQWDPDGGIFCLCLSLEPGVYHFVFRVDNGRKEEMKISEFYDQTYLGNGRAVNYIELRSSGNAKIRRRPRCKYRHIYIYSAKTRKRMLNIFRTIPSFTSYPCRSLLTENNDKNNITNVRLYTFFVAFWWRAKGLPILTPHA